MCVLRNLSYQLYGEIPPSALVRLEGPTRDQASGKGEAIGCFTPQSRKAKNVCRREIYPSAFCQRGADCLSQHCVLLSFFSWQSKNRDLSTFTEVARVPKGMEWLWHPEIVKVYNNVLHQCEINSTTREAAAGALQNITAGDRRVSNLLVISPVKSLKMQKYRIWFYSLSLSLLVLQWASVLSRVALEQERMLPVLLDNLRTNNDLELRSLTGLLRNLSRHCTNKNDMGKFLPFLFLFFFYPCWV